MLAESFRAIPVHTTRMRELLTDPVLLAAIVCLRDEVTEMLRGPGAQSPEAELNFVKGANNIIDLFLELAEPPPALEPEPEATWGVDETRIAGSKPSK